MTDQPDLTDEQRQALRVLAECFADDGIVDDAKNIRDALACLHALEDRFKRAESESGALRVRLDETERRLRAAEAAAILDGWKGRAEAAEGKVERLAQERNEARAAAQAILVSLKAQGHAADTAEASAAALRRRVDMLEEALREAGEIMRDCALMLADPEAAREAQNVPDDASRLSDGADDGMQTDRDGDEPPVDTGRDDTGSDEARDP